jgi:prepilin peptidase CpaA
MYKPFFPDAGFGWAFFGILAVLTAVAAVVDLRKMVIPKWLTIPTLALGVLFNTARGAWMGELDQGTWAFAPRGMLLGAFDGFLFALVGFLAGFAIFLMMWILGMCAGGDVKLFAAIGAWVGPYYCLWVLAGSMIVLIVLSLLRTLVLFSTRGFAETRKAYSARQGQHRKKGQLAPVPRHRLMTYSLPLAVATAAVILWFFRFDLHLAIPPAASQGGQPRQVSQNI